MWLTLQLHYGISIDFVAEPIFPLSALAADSFDLVAADIRHISLFPTTRLCDRHQGRCNLPDRDFAGVIHTNLTNPRKEGRQAEALALASIGKTAILPSCIIAKKSWIKTLCVIRVRSFTHSVFLHLLCVSTSVQGSGHGAALHRRAGPRVWVKVSILHEGRSCYK
jgi:hypothetical protein